MNVILLELETESTSYKSIQYGGTIDGPWLSIYQEEDIESKIYIFYCRFRRQYRLAPPLQGTPRIST